MPLRIDKAILKERFSAASATYEDWATPQRQAAERLCAMLPPAPAPESVLDVGCGIGTLTALLRERYEGARIRALDIAPGMAETCRKRFKKDPLIECVEADAELLDCAERFDLVASSFCAQWFTRPRESLLAMRKSVAQGGRLALATPVAGTLPELSEAFQAAVGRDIPSLNWRSAKDFLAILNEAGLCAAIADTLDLHADFETPVHVLRFFKKIGATLQGHNGHKSLGAGSMRRLVDTYRERFGRDDGTVPVTFRVLFYVSEVAN